MSPEATELTLYADNEEPIYRQKMVIFRALAKKKDRGVYEPKLAPKAFAALLNAELPDLAQVALRLLVAQQHQQGRVGDALHRAAVLRLRERTERLREQLKEVF